MKTVTGLERLLNEKTLQKVIEGNFGYLCHAASVTDDLTLGVKPLQDIFGNRLKKLFGPQHGMVTDVQDNMVETKDFIHPYFQLPVHSLYSQTRKPTEDMLEGLDTFVIDLQDVGTRVYTYISTMALAIEECAKKGIKVVILDRPNPVGGELVEGNMIENKWSSFVGTLPLPMRHGLTMGEVANFIKKYVTADINLEVITMKEWSRSHFWRNTSLEWIFPSPNLPTADGAITFCGTVLFEGTTLSEGRGTTRSLEIIGHPKISPFAIKDLMEKELNDHGLNGFILRPLYFRPTFQKHANVTCGGFQIHVTEPSKFRSWRLGQFLQYFLYNHTDIENFWTDIPYEYEYENLAIDYINGTQEIREIIEKQSGFERIVEREQKDLSQFKGKREEILLYQ